jgi:Delta24(24(1))-sterol reductase
VTGSIVYDFFMGAALNPRLLGGRLDLKMWAETRVSWTLLFLVTVSCAAQQHEEKGYITAPMACMVLAHFLYGNACTKGEECIPTTWDIFHENFGWMLAFWNLAGVPFLYAAQSVYILRADPRHSAVYMVAVFVLLFASYYVWDTANSQKNRFRMQRNGTDVTRTAWPQLPWGVLQDPEVRGYLHPCLLARCCWSVINSLQRCV